jgi:hypothetical protein
MQYYLTQAGLEFLEEDFTSPRKRGAATTPIKPGSKKSKRKAKRLITRWQLPKVGVQSQEPLSPRSFPFGSPNPAHRVVIQKQHGGSADKPYTSALGVKMVRKAKGARVGTELIAGGGRERALSRAAMIQQEKERAATLKKYGI